MHQAFILAAGFGTRLQPLTLERPKPLVPMCGVPMLSYALALCARHGMNDVVVNAHHLAGQLLRWEGEHEGCTVRVVVEAPGILGTGGGLKQVEADLASVVTVLNADVLHDVDLTALRAGVPDGGANLALRPDTDNAERYGVVATDGSGVVIDLAGLATAQAQGSPDRTSYFTGIHALHRDVLAHVPDGFACIVRTAYSELTPARQLKGQRYSGPWLDAGDPGAYLQANLDVLHRRVVLALDPHPRAAAWADAKGQRHGEVALLAGVDLAEAVWLGRDVELGQAVRLSDTVVGDGARVPSGTSLNRTVVWDGVEVPPGHWQDVIFTSAGPVEVSR
jgi:NDP-sugar pyrophosphorylase family protein